MTKWEYAVLLGRTPEVTIRYFGDTETEERHPYAEFARVIARMGLDGWEMVGADYATGATLWFKRPVE